MKKLIGSVLLICLLLFGFELTIRSYLSLQFHSNFFKPKEILYHYYPMVKEIRANYDLSPKKKVLILSSSALTDGWGGFASIFAKELNKNTEDWDVYNASGVGFSSLDNLNTYSMLSDLEFDVLLFYNGINDSRLNNCPPEIYKENYRHIAWNNEIAAILRHPELNRSTIPFFIDFSFQKIKYALCKDCFLSENYHDQEDWQEYGSNYKSLESFQQNIQSLIEMKPLESKLILVSFATYVPANYSFEKFVSKELDYNYHTNSREVEVWGKAHNVVGFMDNLNNILSTSQNPTKETYFIDIRAQVNAPTNFADVCHYSTLGIQQAAQVISDSLHTKIN